MNYLYQLISAVGVGAISFGLSLFIARQVGASLFGQYSTALAIGSIVAIAFDGGLRNLLMREHTKVSKNLEDLQLNLPAIAMGHSLAAATLASIACFVIFPDKIHLGLGIIWCFWGVVITQYASAILRGEGRLKADSLWQLKQRTVTAALITISVSLGYIEAWQLLLTWAIGNLFANLFFREGFQFRLFFKTLIFPTIKLYRTLLPLFWIDLATTIYFRSDLILLKNLQVPDDNIGQYAAAYRLIEATILVASPFSIIIFRKVRLLHEERILQSKYITKSILLGLLFGIFGLTLIELLTKTMVELAYGAQYPQAASILSILAWMAVLLIPNTILTQTALALHLEKFYALTATLAAGVNIGLNFLFIPEHGVLAAAYSSIATELVIFTGLSFAINQKIKK